MAGKEELRCPESYRQHSPISSGRTRGNGFQIPESRVRWGSGGKNSSL